MFAKVLVPTDFSSYADAVLHCIQGIPGIREVVLLHVPPWSSDVSARKASTENLRGHLNQYEAELRKGDLAVSSLVLTTPAAGSISETILRVAREENVNLILIGARGKGIIRGILLGSVSSEIVRRAPTNVLIMRHKVLETLEGVRYEKFCPRIYAKILIPTDFSDASRRSLALLDDLPGVGEIILAHVVNHGEEPEIVRAYVEDAELALTALKNDLSPRKFNITTAVRVGSPPHEIQRIADEKDVSLVLVTPGKKGELEQFLLGSTAYTITEIANRPVLVVKTPAE